MATLTLYPNADSAAALSRSAGASNFSCVDESVLDTGDYVYNQVVGDGGAHSSTLLDKYGLPNHTTESGTINSVTVKAYVGLDSYTGTSYSAARLGVFLGANSTYSDILTGSGNAYKTATLARPGGGSWAWTDIDDLVAAVEGSYVIGAGEFDTVTVEFFQVYVEVDYTPTTFIPQIIIT